jgi:tryptophan-rich sensory protein
MWIKIGKAMQETKWGLLPIVGLILIVGAIMCIQRVPILTYAFVLLVLFLCWLGILIYSTICYRRCNGKT